MDSTYVLAARPQRCIRLPKTFRLDGNSDGSTPPGLRTPTSSSPQPSNGFKCHRSNRATILHNVSRATGISRRNSMSWASRNPPYAEAETWTQPYWNATTSLASARTSKELYSRQPELKLLVSEDIYPHLATFAKDMLIHKKSAEWG